MSVEANIIELNNDNFETEVLKSDTPVLVDFWAAWCGPCKKVGPIMDDLAKRFAGKLKVGKIDVDEQQDLAISYNVMSIPTIILFDKGEIIDTMIGLLDTYGYENALRAVGLEY